MAHEPYISTIEAHGWNLYDASRPEVLQGSWEALEAEGPVRTVGSAGIFLFAPQPQEGQSLREAFAATQGLGPSLGINDPGAPEYKTLLQGYSPKFVVFTRFVLSSADLSLFVHPTKEGFPSDFVALHIPGAQEVFERDFYIISQEEFLREYNAWKTQHRRS